MHPDLFDLIAVCEKHAVGHVVLAGGIPPKGSVEAIKGGKNPAKVICFAPTLALAKKLLRSGADALVIEGMEAGGHIGPVSTSVLAQEMLPELAQDHLIFVAGGIGRGRRSRAIWKWVRPASSSARVSPARRKASPIPISRRRFSAPARAMRSPACRSIRGCR